MVSLGISDRLIKAAITVALIIVLIIITIWGVGIFFGVLPDTLVIT
jgi:hypothetical protein